MNVKKGDRFTWKSGPGATPVGIEVLRVAKDGTWADILVQPGAGQWTKRQRLPFQDTFHRVPAGES